MIRTIGAMTWVCSKVLDLGHNRPCVVVEHISGIRVIINSQYLYESSVPKEGLNNKVGIILQV